MAVLDFDGVICDSFYDSILTACNTYINMFPGHRLPVTSALRGKEVFGFAEKNRLFAKQFHDLMPLGNFAHDYYVILNILENHAFSEIRDQQSFDTYKERCSADRIDEFQKKFYELRSSMQTQHPREWTEQNPPFPGVVSAVRALSERCTLAVATSKDFRSVAMLMESYGISGLFNAENILDKDYARSKREHLETFARQHNVEYNRIHFIDDKLLHLVSAADLGVNLYLSTWGFNTDREWAEAKSRGFSLLTIDGLQTLGAE